MLKVSIVIDVSDLGTAVAFYQGALGCALEREQPTHVTLRAAGVTIHLSEKPPGSKAASTCDATRSYARHWTPVHLDFDVDDLDARVALVEQRGGAVEDTRRGDWGAAAFCVDPFGNGFCLLELR
ncbi:MAG: VOC family protein [Myxococcales bacterium]|nr:VOC family protein [Myxococcales bacterium]